MSATGALAPITVAAASRSKRIGALARRSPVATLGVLILAAIAVAALLAPILGTIDPLALSPVRKLRPPSAAYWFGTDQIGRDVYSRVVYGARVSLAVGFCVTTLALAGGVLLGLASGLARAVDAVVSRCLEGLMAVPAVLTAIALMAITGASIEGVVVAIAVAEIPRVARLVRSLVLVLRDQPYIEAARAGGTSRVRVLYRHMLPNMLGPLIVQGSYICASAILTEATLSFLGAGTPADIPSWGNIMAEGRGLFRVAPHVIFFPGLLLALTVLSVNLVGDGLRDACDPRMALTGQ